MRPLARAGGTATTSKRPTSQAFSALGSPPPINPSAPPHERQHHELRLQPVRRSALQPRLHAVHAGHFVHAPQRERRQLGSTEASALCGPGDGAAPLRSGISSGHPREGSIRSCAIGPTAARPPRPTQAARPRSFTST